MPKLTWVVAVLSAALVAGCVPAQQYDALEAQYNQLNQTLSGEISQDQVRISRFQGAIRVAVNSELLFPSGGWQQMPPAAAATISKMAPILAPVQRVKIAVNGYTDDVPIGPELKRAGIENNRDLSMRRAQTVMNFLVAQGVNPAMLTANGFGDANPAAPNTTAAGRAQNRRVELMIVPTGG